MSAAYPYAPIQMHDSWLAVDPVVGCKASCAYCLLHLAGWTGVRPEVVRGTDEIVADLLGHRYFTPHTTHLAFGTRTDVLLPEVTPHALRFLTALDQRGLRNSVALISKLEVNAETAAALSRLQNVRVVFLASWSALGRGVEKGVPRGAAVRTLHRLRDYGVPSIHYFRPLLPSNTADEVLRHVLATVAGVAGSTVHVGIKLNPRLRPHYAAHPALKPAAEVDDEYGTWVPDDAVERLRRIAAREFPDHPLYEHTSCAVSHALGEADYTATRHRSDVCHPSHCPTAQRARCAGLPAPRPDDAVAAVRKLGLANDVAVQDGVVHISGVLGQEDYCHLLHTIGSPIDGEVDYFRVFRGGIFEPGHRARNDRGSCNGTPAAHSGQEPG
ncbi:MAG TPA: hypothetical protein VFW65_31595 [Pseudonocardiaceae bacterium]|nr:hypothetical protein [Pseudonocardiaceae bacterium]